MGERRDAHNMQGRYTIHDTYYRKHPIHEFVWLRDNERCHQCRYAIFEGASFSIVRTVNLFTCCRLTHVTRGTKEFRRRNFCALVIPTTYIER